jgi:hypothetical protein
MKLRRIIEFQGKNLNDVFSLDCVKAILKVDGKPVLVLWNMMLLRRSSTIAEIGDQLIQYDNGKWEVNR